jgi:transcriptional regulator with PAS, ATPase and Fis domain
LAGYWKILLDEIRSGVIICNDQDQIELVNRKAAEVLKISVDELVGKDLTYLAKEDKSLLPVLSKREINDDPIRYMGNDLVLSLKLVSHDNFVSGKIILINPYTELKEVQQKVHRKIVGSENRARYHFSDLIGEDASFVRCRELSKKVARSESTVLLLGESGTGKELFASAIHNYSHRRGKPFVAINCATLPENLLESELFGYVEGAFTGARKGGKVGLFERAHGGTLFLDEIADLPLSLQARLLRALEEKEIRRVGGETIISVDARIIAASNKDIIRLTGEGLFRKDLLYRLNVFQITLPPLRKRINDIPVLIGYFIDKFGIKCRSCADFLTFCKRYHWPGNVRELRNVLDYMKTTCNSNLSLDVLPDYLKQREYYVDGDGAGELLLLRLIYNCNRSGKSIGRRTATKLFNTMYYEISEPELRGLTKCLADKGHLAIRKGRRGCEVTEKGIEILAAGGIPDENKWAKSVFPRTRWRSFQGD